MQHILALGKQAVEEVEILGDVHLRGAGGGAVGHGLIEIVIGDGLSKIVLMAFSVQRIMEADIGNVPRFKMLTCQICSGTTGEKVFVHESSFQPAWLRDILLLSYRTSG